MAPDNKYLAISTSDNGIQIVDPQLKLISVIQHFTWQVEAKHGLPLFPAGINVDPRTKALVMNGRTGHIQLYSPRSGTLLYNLDITQMNYLTQERNDIIVNTDVMKVSLNCNGEWMATVEERDDGESNMEVRLKFWHYDTVKQSFCLNTSVELPHIGGVSSVGFQPTTDPQQQLAVTAGRDLKFRIWSLVESSSIYKKGVMVWRCESVGFFRSLPIGDTSFSADGSLLAVTFGPTLTVWVPETNQLKCSLTELHVQINLSHVQFGMIDCGHLVVTGSPVNINVWHLLTLSLVWTVPINVSILKADPYSEFMAVFTSNNDLFVFSPRCSKPVYIQKHIVHENSSILCAAFVPRFSLDRPSGISWQEHSLLYFLSSDQELLTLERPYEDANEKEGLTLPVSSLQPATFFSSLLAKHRISDVEKLHIDTEQQLGEPGAFAIRDMLSAQAHTMPPMNLLCGPVLHSLVVSNSKQTEGKNTSLKEREMDKADRMEIEDSGVDSEDETPGHELLKPRGVKDEASKVKISDLTRPMNVADVELRLASVLEEKFDWTALLFQ
jgi:NET1-associated nuclear protein 1 (U3 small nucleolar RNA-associated protein 17)